MMEESSGADDAPRDVTAVVDRIEDGRHAVLLIGPDEVELVVDATLLPEGTAEGDWLRVDLVRDPALTAERREAIERRMDRIRRTRKGGRFG